MPAISCGVPELSPGGFVFGRHGGKAAGSATMHGLIYLIGLIVVILFILSLFGLR
jgi:hypothetical protein